MKTAARFGTLLCIASLLSSCATGTSPVTAFTDARYARESTDPACHARRSELVSYREFFDEALIAIGAGGALIGFFDAVRRGENPVEGGLKGAAVAVALGYLSKYSGVGPYQAINSMVTDVEAENAKLAAFNVTLTALLDCRTQEADAINARFRAGTLDRTAAEKAMAEVRERQREDIEVSETIVASITSRTESYAAAYNEIAAANNVGGLEVREYRAGRESVRRTSVPAARAPQSQQNSLRLANASERRAIGKLRDDCVTNVRRRDDCLKTVTQIRNQELKLKA